VVRSRSTRWKKIVERERLKRENGKGKDKPNGGN
jgi:hypothetical protein